MTQKYAAVDLGAESGRVVVGYFDGKTIRLEDAHRFPNVPVKAGDTLHWDILRLWNDIQDGLASVALKQGGDLAGIGVDTWGVDFGFLDKHDQLIGNPVHYRDARNDGMMQKAFEIVPREELFRETGLQFMPFNTLFQLLALKQTNSPHLDIAKSFLFVPDLLHFWLTGNKANEYTIASTSQMLEPAARNWNNELLAKFDIPTNLFPDLRSPATSLGAIRASVAARTGISGDTHVFLPGSHDTASAVASVPAEGENWAYLSSGTWSLMGIELPQPLVNDRVAELNFTNEGGLAGTIRFLKNIAGLWLVQECRRTWLRAGDEYNYSQLTNFASDAPPLQAIVEPDDPSFAAPGDMPKAIRDYCQKTGQTPPNSVGATVRCCLESLALKYRWTFERLEEVRGAKLDVLYIVGGGTQNKLLNQFAADCLNRPVVCGPVEATAVGNVLTQALARGELSGLAELRAVVRNSFELETYHPNPETRGAWDEAYGRYLELL